MVTTYQQLSDVLTTGSGGQRAARLTPESFPLNAHNQTYSCRSSRVMLHKLVEHSSDMRQVSELGWRFVLVKQGHWTLIVCLWFLRCSFFEESHLLHAFSFLFRRLDDD